jgi:hypothetical protein
MPPSDRRRGATGAFVLMGFLGLGWQAERFDAMFRFIIVRLTPVMPD